MSKITSLCWVGLLLTFFLLGGCFSSDKKGNEQAREERSSTEGGKSSIGNVQECAKSIANIEPGSLPQEKPFKNVVLNPGEEINIQSTLTPQPLISSEVEGSENTEPLPPESKPSEVEEAGIPVESGEVGNEQVSSDTTAKTQQEDALQSGELVQPEFSKVKIGMSYSEVVEVLGEPDMLVSAQKESDTYIYLWRRQESSFYGKFVKGVLSRHSGKFEEAMEAPPLTEELYHQVNLGMSIDEVNLLLKREGRKISGEGDEEGIFLWSDNKSGTSFSARFDGGKLVRKSSFYSKPKVAGEVATKEKESVVKPEVEELSREENPEENPPGNIHPSTKEKGQTPGKLTLSSDELVPENNLIHQQSSELENMENKDDVRSSPNPQRIISVGKRTQVEGQKVSPDQSMKETGRKAKLPAFTYQLREGSYEIKIHNPLDVEVTVGIRSEKRGKNFTIEPRGARSVKVPRGEYQIYYIRSDEPSRVIDGGSVNIDGLFVGDVDIHLIR